MCERLLGCWGCALAVSLRVRMWDCRWVRPLVFDDVLSSIYDVCVSFYLGNGCMNERHRTQTNSGTLGQGQLSSLGIYLIV